MLDNYVIIAGQFVGFPPAAQGMLQNMFQFGGAQVSLLSFGPIVALGDHVYSFPNILTLQLGSLPMMPAQAMSQQVNANGFYVLHININSLIRYSVS